MTQFWNFSYWVIQQKMTENILFENFKLCSVFFDEIIDQTTRDLFGKNSACLDIFKRRYDERYANKISKFIRFYLCVWRICSLRLEEEFIAWIKILSKGSLVVSMNRSTSFHNSLHKKVKGCSKNQRKQEEISILNKKWKKDFHQFEFIFGHSNRACFAKDKELEIQYWTLIERILLDSEISHIVKLILTLDCLIFSYWEIW